ncbi:hypothetical protein [Alkalibacillus haloalkaliphilus]|uniref:hypothetical protein n=1 Tax=Alkalibacillus haloalkaliphilus TaxID=94136 RepID=UPI0029355CD1|nr:hypothetical protein [Alkalibacillus haloalkaliphilus]MDV2581394.1 hypothetical protein [Alkalibacillus haloalkaliphilus]
MRLNNKKEKSSRGGWIFSISSTSPDFSGVFFIFPAKWDDIPAKKFIIRRNFLYSGEVDWFSGERRISTKIAQLHHAAHA